ncbi:MAG: hypothetical protein ACLQLG_18610 [Thermoguttaceae bacterium]
MEFGWNVKYVDTTEQVLRGLRRAALRSLARLGFLVRAKAKASIEDEPGPSRPGTPPHTHKRVTTKKGNEGKQGLLPASILYAVDRESMSVFAGPSVNVVGTVGAAFEHPGEETYRGQEYPDRSFMGPALGEEIGELSGLLAENFGKV